MRLEISPDLGFEFLSGTDHFGYFGDRIVVEVHGWVSPFPLVRLQVLMSDGATQCALSAVSSASLSAILGDLTGDESLPAASIIMQGPCRRRFPGVAVRRVGFIGFPSDQNPQSLVE